MKYFTKEEARSVIRKGSISLLTADEDNPNREAVMALREEIEQSHFQDSALWMACLGFILGRATGIREERARRKEATSK